MKRSLRKSDADVSVAYSDGGYSNNLRGEDFELERLDAGISLSINLTSNLLVRNKAANCYADASEFVEKHALLESVQIFDSDVVRGVLDTCDKNPNAEWKLRLLLGTRKAFEYSVRPETSNVDLRLYVCNA